MLFSAAKATDIGNRKYTLTTPFYLRLIVEKDKRWFRHTLSVNHMGLLKGIIGFGAIHRLLLHCS
jgi:hypothetical protein